MEKLKKFWDWLWHSNSFLSWIVLFIFIFIIVKFIFFPFLSFVLNTEMPLVVVKSGSMHHEGSFEEFWQQQGGFYEKIGITKDQFDNFPFKNGFDKGDVIIVKGCEDYNIGEVIVFKTEKYGAIIHRIIKKNELFQTKGDFNKESAEFDKNIEKERIVGKAIFRIPKIGWIKIFFSSLLGF